MHTLHLMHHRHTRPADCGPGKAPTYHEQVTAGHADNTDVREGLQDVLQCSSREGEHLLRRVDWHALLDGLQKGRKTSTEKLDRITK